MSDNNSGFGCLVLIGIGVGISLISKACDKTPPPVAQPSTGVVSGAAYPATYVPAPVPVQPPVQPEPSRTLLSGGASYSRTAISFRNDMSDAAYIKVLSGGYTYATIYLRPHESYRLSVNPGYFSIRYVTGSSSQWRGEEHHFGASSEYFQGSQASLDDGDEWSLRLYSQMVRRGTGGGAPRMSKEGF